MLDISTIESGHLELNESNCSLAEIAAETHNLVAVRAKKENVNLDNSIGEGAPSIFVDPLRFKQVLLNLHSNAVKFTPEGGVVETSFTKSKDGSLFIKVKDNGRGMAEAEIEIAESRFGRVNIDGMIQDGTGLGLPLAVAFMESHDGHLVINSVPGKGTEVTIELPKERVRAPLEG